MGAGEVALLALRHAPTAWNRLGKIQGHRDVGLDAEGRAALAGRCLPPRFAAFRWVSSPLARCQETASLLGASELALEARIQEMDWAEWEGLSLVELRRRAPAAMAENEARGLDFRPEGGESPREVRERVGGWLSELLAAGEDTVMVSHKGVIRALLSAATGWDMQGKPPVKLDWRCAHLFAVGAGGCPRLATANIPLVERGEGR